MLFVMLCYKSLPSCAWVSELFSGLCKWVFLYVLPILVKRNSRGKDRLFLRQGNPIFDFFVGLYEGGGIKQVKHVFSYFTEAWRQKFCHKTRWDTNKVPGDIPDCYYPIREKHEHSRWYRGNPKVATPSATLRRRWRFLPGAGEWHSPSNDTCQPKLILAPPFEINPVTVLTLGLSVEVTVFRRGTRKNSEFSSRLELANCHTSCASSKLSLSVLQGRARWCCTTDYVK